MKEFFNMKLRKSPIILFVVAMLLTPMIASAAVGVINVSDGVWDANWGPSLGSSATVDGYYLNVDVSAPGTTTYYFGLDLDSPFPASYFLYMALDCDQNGSYLDAVDFRATLSPPSNFGRTNGDGSNSDATAFPFEIIGAGDQMELEVPITGQNIAQCVNSPNNVRMHNSFMSFVNGRLIAGFDTSANAAGPNAIELQNFSASENSSVSSMLWLISAAVTTAGMIVFLQIRRKKTIKG
jgi:hypothetical protein